MLSIVAVVKNEVRYLREWIEFHLMQGVEHFYITDNGSTDGTHEILKEYADKQIVYWHLDEERPIQFKAYNYWLNFLKAEQFRLPENLRTEWAAFIDVDEFLFCTQCSLLEAIKLIEAKINDYWTTVGAIGVNWVNFGSNGLEKYNPDELVTERFYMRDEEVNPHVKSIVNVKYAERVGKNPHYFELEGLSKVDLGSGVELIACDELRRRLPPVYGYLPDRTERSADYLRIHHYHTKSREEYFERKKNGDPGTGVIHSPERLKVMFDAHNQGKRIDISATKFVPELKQRLGMK